MAELAEELRTGGRRPYVIPGGGSNGLGALGYVRCALELDEQLAGRGERPRYLVCAGGSCGTLSGLTLGLALAGWAGGQRLRRAAGPGRPRVLVRGAADERGGARPPQDPTPLHLVPRVQEFTRLPPREAGRR